LKYLGRRWVGFVNAQTCITCNSGILRTNLTSIQDHHSHLGLSQFIKFGNGRWATHNIRSDTLVSSCRYGFFHDDCEEDEQIKK
jgi:hypothetical protein